MHTMRIARPARIVALAATLSLAGLAPARVAARASHERAHAATALPASLAGSWAMQGTGPAGLVAAGGRIATLQVRQRGHTLAIAIRSGGRTYAAAGTYGYPRPGLAFSWRMALAGTVRFTGSVQAGGTRAIGLWQDAHGDDGGAILTRLR